MKQLVLVRHAKSSWKDASLYDFERPLNKRGKRDAPIMGQRLKNHGVMPDLIISSTAKRASKTAKIIAAEIGYSKDKIVYDEGIYTKTTRELSTFLQATHDSNHTVMLVGHNPEVTEMAEGMSGLTVDNIPTCGIFCLQFQCSSWQDISAANSQLLFFDYPKKGVQKTT